MVAPALLLLALWFQTAAQRAAVLVEQGIELSHRGRFQEAGEKFVQALALDARNAEAHHLLGLVRQQDGRAEAALESFRSALRLNPGFGQAQARVCELETVFARARDTGFDGALASCRRATVLEPKDPEPHFHSGWIHSKLRDYAAAIREFEAALKLDPAFPRVKFELAMAWLDAQQPERAIPMLKQVVGAEPANGNARFQLGAALFKMGDCASAEPMLRQATDAPQTHFLLASCLKKMGRGEEAAAEMEIVKRQREAGDARTRARFLAAMAHQKAEGGDLEGAAADYRESLALVDDAQVRLDLAVALLRTGEAEAVIALLGGDRSPVARYQLALAQAKLGRMKESSALLEQALGERPQFVEALYQLGVNRIATREFVAAERALGQAVKLRPDEPAMRLAWAESLERLGRIQEARAQRALAPKPRP